MSAYREFTGKTVEEALRNAREAFEVGLDDLDFEILTPGSRGVLGMGAELARIVAAPRSALGGAAPKREAASAQPLPAPPPREERAPRREFRERGPRREGGHHERGADESGGRRQPGGSRAGAPEDAAAGRGQGRGRGGETGGRDRGAREGGRGARGTERRGRSSSGRSDLSATEVAEVEAARDSVAPEHPEVEAAEASPEALKVGKEILEELMEHLGFKARVEVDAGETSRLNVVGEESEKEALGALIGRKGERLSALQHLVNLMLSRRMDTWTRVLVDVEDYRGRRERQLREIARRAADRVAETGKMLQLDPMPALERRWIHIALRDHPGVSTQSIGEEPNRRVVVLPRSL